MKMSLPMKNLRTFQWIPILFATPWIASCGNDDLPKYQTLSELRVLAVKADVPEAAPGGTVNVSALINDLDRGRQTGGTLSVNFTLEACLDPGIGYGATPSCAGSATLVTVQTGSINLTAPTYTAAQTFSSITIPASAIIFGGRSAQDQFNGVNYLVVLTLNNGSQTTVAFKRIVVSTKTTKNTNPTLTAIQNAAGTSLTSLPGDITTLVPAIGTGAESYLVQLANGTQVANTEKITVTWFTSYGSMRLTRTDGGSSNDWVPPNDANYPRFLIPVIRDDRGGVNYLAGVSVGP